MTRGLRRKARTRRVIDEKHAPLPVIESAQQLPARRWRQVTWRAGTNSPLRSRIAALRVRAANLQRARGRMAADRMAINRSKTRALLVMHAAGRYVDEAPRRNHDGSLAHRARLPGTEIRKQPAALEHLALGTSHAPPGTQALEHHRGEHGVAILGRPYLAGSAASCARYRRRRPYTTGNGRGTNTGFIFAINSPRSSV